MLERLAEVWRAHPDQRLTQLILNACRELAGEAWPDVWNVEDGALLRSLERMRDQGRGEVWELRRQDDHGNVFVVDVYADRTAAEAACAALEARGHKQMYWVESVVRSR
ncbi:MAG: hypothetical protein AAF602_24610 [Myxococcota bacterium]